MKDIEKLLNITGSEEIEIPTCIESKIQNTINNLNEKKNHNLIKQVLKYIIWCIIGICSCGTVYAIHYIDKHSNIYDVGVKDAIQNGYVQEIENVKYNIDNSVKVGISSLLLDDFNFYLDLNLEVDKNIEGYENFKMKDVIIYDDENNIYYADNSNLIEKYFSEKNIPLDRLTELSGYKGITISNVYQNTGIINFMFKNQNNKYPKSKKIYVEFGGLEFSNNVNEMKNNLIYIGNWKIDVEVPEKFQNRESILYNVKNCDDRIIKNQLKLETTETCTKLNLLMQWGDYEYWNNKTNEIRKYDVMGSRYIQIEKCYIENENGDKFYATFESSGSRLNIDGTLNIYCNFGYKKSDYTNDIKIVLIDINNEIIEIDLSK